MSGLPEQESLRAVALDQMLDPVALLEPVRDAAGTVVDLRCAEANTAAVEYLGRDRSDLVGQLLSGLLPQGTAAILVQLCAPVALTGEPLTLTDRELAGTLQFFDLRAWRVDGRIGLTWRDMTDQHAAFVDLVQAADDNRRLAERYQMLVDNAADVVLASEAGILTWISPAVERLLGWTPAELVGAPTVQLWHPDDREGVVALREAAYHGGTGRGLFRLHTRDGDFVWVEVTARPLGDGGMVGVLRDASDQVAASRELAESRDLFRLLAERGTDVVFRGDVDAVLQWVSPSALPVLGRPPADLVGHAIAEFMHPDDIATMHRSSAAANTGEAVTYRARIRHADGSWRWMEVAAEPVRDGDGVIVGRVGSARDVTDQVTAEEELRESRRDYELLAENATDVVFRTDGAGVLQWISNSVEEVLGYPPAELVGRHSSDVVHPADRERAHRVGLEIMSGEKTNARLRLVAADGHDVWADFTIHLVRDEDSEAVLGVVGGWRDVTAEHRQQEELAEERARLEAILDSELEPHVYLEAVRGASGDIVDFIYRDTNEAACTYMGMARTDLEGARVLDLLPGQAGSGMLALYAAAVESGQPLVLDDYTYPHEILSDERRYDIRAIKVGDGLSFAWRDVTDAYESAAALSRSEERYRLLAENVTDVVLHARDGIMRWLSPSLHDLLGWHPEDWVGHRFEEFTHPDDIALAQERLKEITAGASRVTRLRLRATDGTYHWVEIHAAPFSDAAGQPAGIMAAFRGIDDQVRAEAKLVYQAQHDPLTGLLNREQVYRRLESMLTHGHRTGARTFVAYADLDNLKHTNDEHGHTAGDELIRCVAGRITTFLRDDDLVARVGGDEFLLILTGVRGVADATDLLERLLTKVNQPFDSSAGPLHPRLSIGVSEVDPDEDLVSLIHRADTAMYAAKAEGGNRIAFAAPAAGRSRSA